MLANVPLPHDDISIRDSAGHLLPERASFLQHCSSASKSLLNKVPSFLVQTYWQLGSFYKSIVFPYIHYSLKPNAFESHPT